MGPDEEKRYTLVVRGPAQDLLYEHFSRLFDGREGVVVVRDRRRDQRRRSASGAHPERRSHDRRREKPWFVPPPEWPA
jgi:hypothetical protein